MVGAVCWDSRCRTGAYGGWQDCIALRFLQTGLVGNKAVLHRTSCLLVWWMAEARLGPPCSAARAYDCGLMVQRFTAF